MITISEKHEPLPKVKVGMLKQGDTFLINDNKLFIVTNTRQGMNPTCIQLGGKNSGELSHVLNSDLVLQVNLLVEITRL